MKAPKTFCDKDESTVSAIIETPKGSRSKFDFDKETGLFKLNKILPSGLIFPHHFGFIPRTKGEDGDPLDLVVITEAPVFPGNMIECRIVGVIEAMQKERDGKEERNDRFIGIPIVCRDHDHIHTLRNMEENVITNIINFFKDYNRESGKEFTVLKLRGRRTALDLIKKQMV